MKSGVYRALVLVAALCVSGVGVGFSALARADIAPGKTEIVLTFTGDCTLGGEDRLKDKDYSFQSYITREGYGYPFDKVRHIFEADDVTVINLEGVLYDSSRNRVEKTYNFRGPTDYVNIIEQSSIELSFLGNNHTFDYGIPGYRSTVKVLDEAGLDWFAVTDEGIKTWIYEKNGVKIGFSGANITYYAREPQEIKESFEQLKAEGCAFIVAVMHGGQEYGPIQNKSITRYARFLADQGAGLVVGHHPHVLHGIEQYKDSTILYSLGNFAFGGNTKVRERRTMIAQTSLRFDETGRYEGQQLRLLPAYTSGTEVDNNFQPVLVQGEEAQAIIDLVAGMSTIELAPYVEGEGALQAFVPAQAAQAEGE